VGERGEEGERGRERATCARCPMPDALFGRCPFLCKYLLLLTIQTLNFITELRIKKIV